MKTFLFTAVALISLTYFSASSVLAQTEPLCGNIITPENYYYEGQTEELQPITDCSNPFGRTGDLTTFKLDNQIVSNNSTITVDETGTDIYGFDGETYNNRTDAYYYLHQGSDYIRVNTAFEQPAPDAYVAEITNYFDGNQIQTNYYTEMYAANDKLSYFLVSVSPRVYRLDPYDPTKRVVDVYNLLEQYVQKNAKSSRPALLPGTYTVTLAEGGGGPNLSFEYNLLQKLFATIVPTALADYSANTVTFTLTGPTPEPKGASSVLFLPGIMGSRLYEDDDGCNTTGEGQQRWVSLAVCDQLRLSMNDSGNSVNDIYTKSDESAILVSQVYKDFFDNLKYWRDDEKIIKDYVAVPYDWRLGFNSLIKAKKDETTGKIKFDVTSSVQDGYLYKTLEKLAEDSFTGKVTIVTHSNGGLLAKAFLATLDSQDDPLIDKIDVLIMVAPPQLGTPDTLVGMLHGSEILPYLFFGSIVSQATSRQLLSTMPMAYHLLPSVQYFDGSGVTVTTPVLAFEPGSLTTPWAAAYGSNVTSAQQMQAFMQTSSGRVVPAVDNVEVPAVINGSQFGYSNSIHLLMNAWIPPVTMKVYEIAGTGIETIAGIKYYTGRECGVLNSFCFIFKPKVLYKVRHTIDGDGTVVVPSALGMSTSSQNVERRWLNLDAYNRSGVLGTRESKNHSSIFDVPEISNFVINTLKVSTSTNYEYISETQPDIADQDRLQFYLHSPLDMSIKLANGREISSSSPSTNDGVYRRYGELQYISLPNTQSNKTLILTGTAAGSFTLEIEQYKNGSTAKRQSYSAIPSSASTKVTVGITDSSAMQNIILAVDYDGNGSVDVSYNTLGQVVTYANLYSAINSLTAPAFYKKLLIETAKVAEQNYQKSLTKSQFKKLEKGTLNVLKQQIILYTKLRIISTSDQQKIVVIIDNLLNK